MAEIHIEMPKLSEKDRKRMVRWGAIVLVVLALITVAFSVVSPYVDYLWYALDARQPQVFTLAYQTKGLLFIPAFLLAWVLLHFSLKRALRLSLVYAGAPNTTGEVLLSNALHFFQDRGWSVFRIAAPVLAFVGASTFSNEWSTFLAARNAESFGMKDPMFGMDLSFFVFSLPWYRAIVGYVLGVLILTTALTVAVYAGMQALAAMAKVELGRPNVRRHIVLLGGLTLIALGIRLALNPYDYGIVAGEQFTGAGYAGVIRVTAERIGAMLVVLLGLAGIAFSGSDKVYRILGRGGIAIATLWVLGVLITPALLQRLVVEPDKLRKEAPYATRAITMTRYAYGLDKIVSRDFAVKNEPSPEDLQAAGATLDNMRLWDPEVVRQSIEVLQSLKQFYRFNDVDVDRYMIGGKQTQVMLSPRDIHTAGLQGDSRSWLYERLQYTHGFGIVMAAVNAASADGDPKLLIRNIPPETTQELKLTEPRIYFSDYRNEANLPQDQYVLVNSNQPEFDYPAESGEKTTRWTGNGGIPIGGFFRRLALSIVLGDGNLLVSGNVTADTRLLMRRSILERCGRIYPFLKLDDDPYIALVDGKIYWIVDGYTTTDRIPYSNIIGHGGSRLNYIRNSVKVVVDAYSGAMTAYAIEPDEPILKVHRAIYPGLIRDASEVPAGIRAHFRYPEDMFRIQADTLCRYHVTDPGTFLNNNDLWALPEERGLSGTRVRLEPYYVQMTLPGETDPGFVLMIPFNPRLKPNMSGWLAARCDPEKYGEMVLYNFARGASVAGAEQMETTFASDPKVNTAKLQLQGGANTDTEVVIGNMLVIPIGSSVIYAESLFPISRRSGLPAMPRLKKVVLGINGRLEVGDTYQEALDKLFGQKAPAPTEPNTEPQPGPRPATPDAAAIATVRQALGLLDQADAALRAGDFAKYGQLQKQAREMLKKVSR